MPIFWSASISSSTAPLPGVAAVLQSYIANRSRSDPIYIHRKRIIHPVVGHLTTCIHTETGCQPQVRHRELPHKHRPSVLNGYRVFAGYQYVIGPDVPTRISCTGNLCPSAPRGSFPPTPEEIFGCRTELNVNDELSQFCVGPGMRDGALQLLIVDIFHQVGLEQYHYDA